MTIKIQPHVAVFTRTSYDYSTPHPIGSMSRVWFSVEGESLDGFRARMNNVQQTIQDIINKSYGCRDTISKVIYPSTPRERFEDLLTFNNKEK